MFTIRKQFKFEAAHVLDSSFSKCCQQIHGHSYRVELFFRSKVLNADGMVVDFGFVKQAIEALIRQLDHRLIITENQLNFAAYNPLIFPCNPTAENMAQHFFQILQEPLPALFKVRVHETDTGYAEYERD